MLIKPPREYNQGQAHFFWFLPFICDFLAGFFWITAGRLQDHAPYSFYNAVFCRAFTRAAKSPQRRAKKFKKMVVKPLRLRRKHARIKYLKKKGGDVIDHRKGKSGRPGPAKKI